MDNMERAAERRWPPVSANTKLPEVPKDKESLVAKMLRRMASGPGYGRGGGGAASSSASGRNGEDEGGDF